MWRRSGASRRLRSPTRSMTGPRATRTSPRSCWRPATSCHRRCAPRSRAGSRTLPEPARRLLELIAVAGRDVEHDVLVRAGDVDDAALESLVEACVLEADDERYRFNHALAREAVYERLLPARRRALHAALARALEGEAEWAALAHHWHEAHEPEKALEASLAAADDAMRLHAFADARRQLERARALWSDGDQVELLRRLADAARLAGDWEDALGLAEEALAAAESAGDDAAIARAHRLLGRVHNRPETRMAHLECALELVGPEPTEERAALELLLATTPNYGGLPSVMRRRVIAALATARAVGAVAEEGKAHEFLGGAYAYGGDPERGLAHFREARRLAAEHGRFEDAGSILNNHGDALMMLGRVEEALATFEAGFEDVRRAGLALSYGLFIEANMAECEVRLGRWPQADARLTRALGRPVGQPDNRLVLGAVAIQLAARRGAFDEAQELDRELAGAARGERRATVDGDGDGGARGARPRSRRSCRRVADRRPRGAPAGLRRSPDVADDVGARPAGGRPARRAGPRARGHRRAGGRTRRRGVPMRGDPQVRLRAAGRRPGPAGGADPPHARRRRAGGGRRRAAAGPVGRGGRALGRPRVPASRRVRAPARGRGAPGRRRRPPRGRRCAALRPRHGRRAGRRAAARPDRGARAPRPHRPRGARARPGPGARRTTSRRASSRCSSCSPRGAPTARSPRSSS